MFGSAMRFSRRAATKISAPALATHPLPIIVTSGRMKRITSWIVSPDSTWPPGEWMTIRIGASLSLASASSCAVVACASSLVISRRSAPSGSSAGSGAPRRPAAGARGRSSCGSFGSESGSSMAPERPAAATCPPCPAGASSCPNVSIACGRWTGRPRASHHPVMTDELDEQLPRGVAVSRRHGAPPWQVDAGERPSLHVVVEGSFHLVQHEQRVLELAPGDLVLVGAGPPGSAPREQRLRCLPSPPGARSPAGRAALGHVRRRARGAAGAAARRPPSRPRTRALRRASWRS